LVVSGGGLWLRTQRLCEYEVPNVAAHILAPHAAFRTPQQRRFAVAAHWACLPLQTCLCAVSNIGVQLSWWPPFPTVAGGRQ
jgi:hypothetical protein